MLNTGDVREGVSAGVVSFGVWAGDGPGLGRTLSRWMCKRFATSRAAAFGAISNPNFISAIGSLGSPPAVKVDEGLHAPPLDSLLLQPFE